MNNCFTRFTFLFLMLSLSACFEEKELFIPNNDPEDPAFIYKNPENRPQRFLISVGEETFFFKTGNNSIIKIPSGSLLTQNGQLYTGNVVLELIESDKIGDQIIHGKVPVNDGEVFRTSWLLSVQFYAEGEKLTVNPVIPVEWYSHISAEMTDFGLYHEVTSENNIKTWVKKSDTKQQNWVVEHDGELVTGAGCIFALRDSGWYIIANPEMQGQQNSLDICLESDKAFTSANSITYAVTEDTNVLLPLFQTGNQSRFCNTKVKATSNSGIKFVLLSFREDGKHYYAEKSVPVQENIIPKLEPKPMPVEEIIKRIRAL